MQVNCDTEFNEQSLKRQPIRRDAFAVGLLSHDTGKQFIGRADEFCIGTKIVNEGRIPFAACISSVVATQAVGYRPENEIEFEIES